MKSEVPFTITSKATERLVDALRKESAKALRIRAVEDGGDGFTYDLEADDEPGEADIIIESDGLTAYVDPRSLANMRGATIDYVQAEGNGGFLISNPNATCECCR